jgi:hypothetical protein
VILVLFPRGVERREREVVFSHVSYLLVMRGSGAPIFFFKTLPRKGCPATRAAIPPHGWKPGPPGRTW